ncbi:hypothetical protein [Streptacidiphilus carbonis]|uniref:hypothetical protein n=1 Tax=Streptacidiphilus carbonis TaxID=105422 RepID=UPI0005A86F3E|nr:hypothetical protein [Streptacidiphilus carbonis]
MGSWQDLATTVAERLEVASWDERCVFAACVAERLMSGHEALPEDERAPFTLGLRPLLNAVWEGVLGDSTAFDEVKRGIGEYLLSEYCHNDGQNGPNDADEDAAAATLYAAMAYLFGCRDLAGVVSSRAVDAVDQALQRLAEEGGDVPDLDEALVAELRRQLRDLALIATYSAELRHANLGLPVETTNRLRAELRPALSSGAGPR